MELKENELVLFDDGHTEGWLEARYSESAGAFYTIREIVTADGFTERVKEFSNTIILKPAKPRRAFKPTATNCKTLINPAFETEKAYALDDGANGCITRGNRKAFYKFVAKSVCYVDESGNIYAPAFALK